MIKTFEQFSKSQPNPTYTQEEYGNVLYLFIKIIEKYSIFCKTILLKNNKK